MQLLDDTASPVNLDLAYVDTSPTWDGDITGRRLTFGQGVAMEAGIDTGGAFAVSTGTKLDALHGSTAFTIETRHEFLECNELDARILQIGDGDSTGDGWISVRQDNAVQVFAVSFGSYNLFTATDVPTRCLSGSHVVHWVVDTNAAVEERRIRLYIDGSAIPVVRDSGPAVALGATVSLGPMERRVSIGRAYAGIRGLHGSIDFVAIYDRVLIEADIVLRAAVLSANSD